MVRWGALVARAPRSPQASAHRHPRAPRDFSAQPVGSCARGAYSIGSTWSTSRSTITAMPISPSPATMPDATLTVKRSAISL